MTFTATDLTPRIGSEVKVDVPALLDGSVAKELKALLVERGVLVFRDLDITDEQQIAFASTIGTVRLEHGNKSTVITTNKDDSPIFAEYAMGTYYFHIDGTYTDTPGFASVLRPRRVAPWGGQTEFCNTYALYEDLSDQDKAWFETLQAVHSGERSMRHAFPNPTEEQLHAWRTYSPERTHPFVWEHRNGRKSLLTATTIERFVGLAPAESDALRDRMLGLAENPKYLYKHDWRMGDMLVWDNTGTMHRVVPFDPNFGRELNRVVLLGEEQITGVKAALSEQAAFQ